MTFSGWLTIVLFVVLLTALAMPLGRYMAAVFLSPLFLMSKKRQHFLTVGYTDEGGRQQAMIFKINKDDIRATLVVLEARTGRKVLLPFPTTAAKPHDLWKQP